MTWIAWTIIAVVCWGVWATLNKLALRSLGWEHLLVASWLVNTVAVAALLATRVDARVLLSRDGAFATTAGATSLVAIVAFYLALRWGPVAAVTALSALYPAVTAVLAAAFLRESPSVLQWVGVAVAILAVFLLAR